MSNAKPNPERYDLRQIISWTCVNGLPLFIASAGMRVSETETAKVDSVLIFSHLYKNSWKCLTFLMILWPIKFFFLDLQPTKFSEQFNWTVSVQNKERHFCDLRIVHWLLLAPPPRLFFFCSSMFPSHPPPQKIPSIADCWLLVTLVTLYLPKLGLIALS